MKVLGIDPGTAACGYGIVTARGGRLSAVDHGWWKTPAREAPERRLKTIHDEVAALIAEHEPDAVALEESYVGADARIALSVGQARGAVLVACANAELACAEYSPVDGEAGRLRLRTRRQGAGRPDGEGASSACPRCPTPHHAADALAVAICHALASPLRASRWPR